MTRIDPNRTILELTATVIDASFALLGEGVMLASLPAHVETFGAKNARYVAKRYVDCDPASGAVAALTPINSISKLTGTPFTMVEAAKDQAVKRLHQCEFLAAFESKAPFSRAMICQLHKAAYQGAVNGLLPDPSQGYDVELRSRILFGDAHCDFAVTSRVPRPHEPDQEGTMRQMPTGDAQVEQARLFYTAILAAFVERLTSLLPPAEAHALLTECAQKVGGKIQAIVGHTDPEAAGEPLRIVQSILAHGGMVAGPATEGRDGASLTVTGCPYARPIEAASRERDPQEARRVRENACGMCLGLLQGAAARADAGARVARDACMTLGDTHCRFRVEGPR